MLKDVAFTAAGAAKVLHPAVWRTGGVPLGGTVPSLRVLTLVVSGGYPYCMCTRFAHQTVIKAEHGLRQHHLDELSFFFAKVFVGIHVDVLLFGSRCRGQHRSGADVDLAFDSSVSLDRQLGWLREHLEESTLPFCFDLVELQHADASLVANIVKESVTLWSR